MHPHTGGSASISIGLLLALLVVGSEAKKGGATGGKIDTSNVVNPDPTATGIVEAEFEGQEEGLVEGDILIRDDKRGGSANRNAHTDTNKLWPQGIVPYVLDDTVKTKERQWMIDEAIADYNQYTCVKFVPRDREEDYVKFLSKFQGCFAALGREGGEQNINLAFGCWHKGTVIHEMMHTLGFSHEQSRGDRDNFITVHYDRIPKDWHSQYEKLKAEDEDNQGFPYDYSSVMHYPPKVYEGFNGQSITTTDPSQQNRIGQRAGFSNQDIDEINRFYKCRGKTSGVGGQNGCLDKHKDYCENVLDLKDPAKKQRKCQNPDNRSYCKKSCDACGPAPPARVIRPVAPRPPQPASCTDEQPDYCTSTFADNSWVDLCGAVADIRNVCLRSCKQC